MNATRSFHSASKPQRVLDKMQECHRALAKMEHIDRAGTEQEFLDSLAHFLESFRTISQRFYGVVEKQSGTARMRALKVQLNSYSRIGFLIDKAVQETHGDGATIWRRFNVAVSDDMQGRWPPRWESAWGTRTERWPSRFRSRFEPTLRTQAIVGQDWQFAERHATLLQLCRNGLDDLENFVRQNLSVTP